MIAADFNVKRLRTVSLIFRLFGSECVSGDVVIDNSWLCSLDANHPVKVAL